MSACIKYALALLGLCIAFIAAAAIRDMIYGPALEKAAAPPAQEIASTDAAIKTAESKIVIIQQRQNDLPEVIKNAKSAARSRVDNYDSDDIADAWNARLGEYRGNAAADGL